jgi:peptidoglycan/LPS O-acetylase OafA/YrhL
MDAIADHSLPRAHAPLFPRAGQYRPDIDGLRAVAVLSVFAYHLRLPWFPGGFVGVDVFFVISGYLISSIILGDLNRRTFSIGRFYVRRVRRIVPALVALILVLGVIECVTAFPADLIKFAWSALYAALSLSNVYFLNHTNYFDVSADAHPLLHTWSLAVEEQFYVVFPPFLMVLHHRAPRLIAPSLVAIWFGSFILSSYGTYASPEATFYLAHSRAWELLSGALLAVWSDRLRFDAISRNVLSLLGLAMISLAVFGFDVETPFPGAFALLPCAGAAAVIAAGASGPSLVGRLLSIRPAVFVGLISYSLYLWHWPLICLQDNMAILGAGWSWKPEKLLLICCGLLLATVSWLFIERPFRRAFPAAPARAILGAGGAALCAIAAAGGVLVAANGLPGRFSAPAMADAVYLDYGQSHFRLGTCFIVAPYTFADFDRAGCLSPAPDRPNDLLLGDSHAAHLWYGLAHMLPGIHILQATAAGCMPEFRPPSRVSRSCSALMDYILRDYLPAHRVDRLLIAARWGQRDVPALGQVLAWAKAQGIPVTLFGPLVEYTAPLPRLLAEATERDDPGYVADHLIRTYGPLDAALAALAARYDAQYVSMLKLLCRGDVCPSRADDGSPLEFDTDHLTADGSLTVARKLVESQQLH